MSEQPTSVAASASEPDWDDISARLRRPFDPKDVDFRVQGKASDKTGKAQIVAYVDARAVQDRLDEVAGAGNWAFDWTPIAMNGSEVAIAKGTLIIHGVAKSDAGTASNFEQTLGAVSHCFKRAAVQWGIGRYLYHLPPAWEPVEAGGRLGYETLARLRANLPRPNGGGAPPATVRSTREIVTDVAPRPAVGPVPPGSVPIAHQAAPMTPRERMAALGYKGAAYEAEARKILGHDTPYSQDEMARWVIHIAHLERAAAERAATPLEALTGGTRPS